MYDKNQMGCRHPFFVWGRKKKFSCVFSSSLRSDHFRRSHPMLLQDQWHWAIRWLSSATCDSWDSQIPREQEAVSLHMPFLYTVLRCCHSCLVKSSVWSSNVTVSWDNAWWQQPALSGEKKAHGSPLLTVLEGQKEGPSPCRPWRRCLFSHLPSKMASILLLELHYSYINHQLGIISIVPLNTQKNPVTLQEVNWWATTEGSKSWSWAMCIVSLEFLVQTSGLILNLVRLMQRQTEVEVEAEAGSLNTA
jgi:hypothetical protein